MNTLNQLGALPVIKPLIALLHSRRFIVALAVVLSLLVVIVRPDLAAYQSTIATVLVVLASVLIGGMTIEDAAKAVSNSPAKLDAAVADGANAALEAIAPDLAPLTHITPELVDAIVAAIEKRSTTPAQG